MIKRKKQNHPLITDNNAVGKKKVNKPRILPPIPLLVLSYRCNIVLYF